MKLSYALRGKVWRYPGAAGWHFVTLPKRASAEIREVFGGGPGWGSIRVVVIVGRSRWRTSIFPDKNAGGYLLPLKSAVRKAEGIEEGAMLNFRLEVGA